ncbi:MAG: FAD binding domain-containing protein, partial [Leptothrix sp. (in: b-proteobacteria)]
RYSGPNAAGPTGDGAAPQHFHAPRRLTDLAWLREMHPEARLLAGATDIGLWVNKQLRDLGTLIYLGNVTELQQIRQAKSAAGTELQIGAAVALEDAWAALAGHWPELSEVWRRFASPPIRHAGTLGGNLANGSPIGDGAPVLIALAARLVLQRAEQTRSVPLDAFYLDYMKNQLQPGEFISRIDVPLPPAGPRDVLRVWKLSKRFDSDISAVCAAFALQLDGGVVRSVRLVYGGMAATVRRAASAERELLGQPWCEERVRAAMQALDLDFKPLSDMRASSAYRAKTAANLLWRLWLETRPDAPLAPAQTSVWPVARP